MATFRITQAELERDLKGFLAKVRQGDEVVVQEGYAPVAVIRPPQRSGRPISEIIRDLKDRNSTVTLDDEFGKDMEEIIAMGQEPWNPPSWD